MAQHYIILPVEGKLGEVALTAMLLTCGEVGCLKRGGRENESFYRIPSASRDGLELLSRQWQITFCVIIKNDLSWSLSVHGHKIDPQSCAFLSNIE